MANQGSAGNFVFVSDISQGKAKYSIQIIGPQDDDSFSTSNFNFVYNLRPQFNFSSDMPKRQFCICGPGDDCSTNDRCLCVNRSKVKMAKRERVGNIDALGENGFSSTLFECTPECGCSGHCGNRLIPDGQKNQFEIFKKPNVGFACRTLKSIRKGNFVSCLAGEVLPESPDDLKPKSTTNNPPGFAFQDKTLQLGFFVRTDRLANESRFFNNGCCPNLVPIFVYSKTAIMERPIVVFVARHEINPQEELTFYYGDYWFLRILRDNPKFKCRCNSPFCIWPPAIEDDEEEEEILIERLRTERINKDREISCERHEKKKKYHQNRVLQCSSQSNANTTSQAQDERGDN